MPKPSRWTVEKRYEIVMEAIKGKEPIAAIARKHQVSDCYASKRNTSRRSTQERTCTRRRESHTCRSVRLDRHDYEHRIRGKCCARKRRRLKSRLQKTEEEILKIGLWIRLTRKQSGKRCSTRQLPTPFLPAMRHRLCRIQAKILSRNRHRKAFQFFRNGDSMGDAFRGIFRRCNCPV